MQPRPVCRIGSECFFFVGEGVIIEVPEIAEECITSYYQVPLNCRFLFFHPPEHGYGMPD